jgi:ABC-type uncharacterized transport system permease subunit
MRERPVLTTKPLNLKSQIQLILDIMTVIIIVMMIAVEFNDPFTVYCKSHGLIVLRLCVNYLIEIFAFSFHRSSRVL